MSMTKRTLEYPFREGHLLPISTLAACLTRVGRVDFDKSSASFCRFAVQLCKECRPRGVCNAFRQTMVMGHTVRLQVLHADDPIRIDDLAACLMREVLPPPSGTLMHTCYSLAMLTPFGCAFGKLGVLALHFGKRLFFLAEKARIVDLCPIRQGSECLESDINANSSVIFWQALGFALHRETGVPLARTAFVDRERFHLALERAMQDDLHMTNDRKSKFALLINLKAKLRVGEAIVAPFAFQTGIAWLLIRFHPSEEGLECQINAHCHILQDLGVDFQQRGTFLFQYGIGSMLLIKRQALTGLLIGYLALFKQMIIQPTTLFKGLVEQAVLLLCWVYSIPKHFTHKANIYL